MHKTHASGSQQSLQSFACLNNVRCLFMHISIHCQLDIDMSSDRLQCLYIDACACNILCINSGVERSNEYKCIADQDKHDITHDKSSVKEYKRPLRGSKKGKSNGLEHCESQRLRRWPVIEAFCLCSNRPFDRW